VSVAFTKEDSAQTASETLLPNRPVSAEPNLVTPVGLLALETHLAAARVALETASRIDDIDERRRQSAVPLRDVRYFGERVRSAQPVPPPESSRSVAFGCTVTFRRDDGRVHTYRIVGEDEADPSDGSISYVSPIARALLGKSLGDEAALGAHELEIIAIA
jgi:transcription elongation GreA/GreB family factor